MADLDLEDQGSGRPYGHVPAAPESAVAIFGERLPLAEAYARRLAVDGVIQGVIGPREVPRLWDRHLLNCAVVAELVPDGATVIDVGSGAGLPGIPIALARPDLSIVLLEPLARRVRFLEDAAMPLGLTRVRVVRGRAQDQGGTMAAEVVTARAVASLDRLVNWCLPLLVPGGRLLAIKGASAGAELDRCASAVRAAGGRHAQIRLCGAGRVDPPVTVVEIVKGNRPAKRRSTA